VADIIDGEAIIMNLNHGAYYSLAGTGAEAWQLLAGGATCAEAARVISVLHSAADNDQVAADLVRLLERLLEEGLLVEDPTRTEPGAFDLQGNDEYSTPTLEKYGDMKEMLALDPPIPRFNG
jgi:Coenzyme PQQ synthesis protein D (PqqD)